jgi:hypothetical protein
MHNENDKIAIAYMIQHGYLTPENAENETEIFRALISWQADRDAEENDKEEVYNDDDWNLLSTK